ncbi:hypothetical protein RB195_004149 [Necator americanus]|uniref:Uncharacterized protein n=1 Tax=Necator americanus TaxID=51031 RepID=A0ABR1BKD4_NECAM
MSEGPISIVAVRSTPSLGSQYVPRKLLLISIDVVSSVPDLKQCYHHVNKQHCCLPPSTHTHPHPGTSSIVVSEVLGPILMMELPAYSAFLMLQAGGTLSSLRYCANMFYIESIPLKMSVAGAHFFPDPQPYGVRRGRLRKYKFYLLCVSIQQTVCFTKTTLRLSYQATCYA